MYTRTSENGDGSPGMDWAGFGCNGGRVVSLFSSDVLLPIPLYVRVAIFWVEGAGFWNLSPWWKGFGAAFCFGFCLLGAELGVLE